MNEKNIQTRVGLFMLLGLATVAALIVYFGRFGEGMHHYYKLNVVYSNANGIKKGADVLLSGARIGRVAESPTILPDMQGVNVPLLIYNEVKIPEGTRFSIGSSGLLGDRFIEAIVGKDITKASPLSAGATVPGEREAAISDIIATVNRIAEQASRLMTNLDTAVLDVDLVAKKVHNDLLQPDSIQNFSTTLANLKNASQRMDGMMNSTNTAVEDIRKSASDLRSIFNKEVTSNLRAFILNLRKSGVLWYKNNPNQ